MNRFFINLLILWRKFKNNVARLIDTLNNNEAFLYIRDLIHDCFLHSWVRIIIRDIFYLALSLWKLYTDIVTNTIILILKVDFYIWIIINNFPHHEPFLQKNFKKNDTRQFSTWFLIFFSSRHSFLVFRRILFILYIACLILLTICFTI